MSTCFARQYKVPLPKRSKPSRTRPAALEVVKGSSRKVGHVSPELAAQWTRLQASFARAFRVYVKGERASALPLFRSVIEDCERMRAEWPNVASKSYLSALPFGPQTRLVRHHFEATDSHSSWFSLYADALVHAALILGRDPDLRLDSEDDKESSLLLRRAEELHKLAVHDSVGLRYTDPRSCLTWANVFILSTLTSDWMARSDYDPSRHADNWHDHYQRQNAAIYAAMQIADRALYTTYPPSKLIAQAELSKSLSSNESHSSSEPRLPVLTEARVFAYIGTRLLDAIEDLDSDYRETWVDQAQMCFGVALESASVPFENDAKYAAHLGQARIALFIAHMLFPDEEDYDARDSAWDPVDRRNRGHKYLDRVMPSFKAAEKVAKECAGRDDLAIPVSFEDAKDLVEDALGLLVGRGARSGQEEDQWRAYAEEHGYELSDKAPADRLGNRSGSGSGWSSAEGDSDEYGTEDPTEDIESEEMP